MASPASAIFASAAVPPSLMAWLTQCLRCSSSNPSETACNALVAAEI